MQTVLVFKHILERHRTYGPIKTVLMSSCTDNLNEKECFSTRVTNILDMNRSSTTKEFAPRFVINPNGKLKNYWNGVMVFMLAYTATVTPFLLAFIDSSIYDWIFWVDYFVTFLFLIDFIINFLTAYYDAHNNLVTDRKAIIIKYVKTWMIIDFLSWFPIDLIINNQTASTKSISKYIRIPKIYRLFRLSRLLKLLKSHFNEELMYKIQETLSLNSNSMRLYKSCLSILVFVHIFSCFWYLAASLNDFSPETWVFRYGYLDHDVFSLYITCVYWAVATLSTTGYGDIVPLTVVEKVLCLVWMGCGLYFFSFVISSLNSMLSSVDLKENALATKLATIDGFSSEVNLKKNLRIKLKNSLKYAVDKRGFSWTDKLNIVSELPKYLRYEIALNMHCGAARHLNFFYDKDKSIVALIVPLLDPVFAEKDSWVYKQGDFADEIYFLVKGSIRLLLDSSIPIKSIHRGGYFGDVEILKGVSRRFSAKSTRFSEMLSMNKGLINQIRQNYEHIWQDMLKTALEREKNYERTVIEIHEMDKLYLKGNINQDSILLYKETVEKLLKKKMHEINWSPESEPIPILIKKINELINLINSQDKNKIKQ